MTQALYAHINNKKKKLKKKLKKKKYQHGLGPITRLGGGLARPSSLHLSTIPVANVVYDDVPNVFQLE
jgi:hypothetical protein